jgi:hypothetical protein
MGTKRAKQMAFNSIVDDGITGEPFSLLCATGRMVTKQ